MIFIDYTVTPFKIVNSIPNMSLEVLAASKDFPQEFLLTYDIYGIEIVPFSKFLVT